MLDDGVDPRHAGVLVATLVRHAVAEQEYVYPTVTDAAPGGERLADRGRAQHAQLDETMQQLSTTDPADPYFGRLLEALATQVRRHLRYDVAELFPTLRRVCTHADLARLGERLARTQETPVTGVRHGPARLVEQVLEALSRRDDR